MEIISEKEPNLWNHSYSSSLLMRRLVDEDSMICNEAKALVFGVDHAEVG